MKNTFGTVNLCLTASVGLVLALVILGQKREILSLQSELSGVKTELGQASSQRDASKGKLVTHGLEILSDKGNVVAAIRPIGEGVQIQLQSFSSSSQQSSNVYLFAEDGAGPAITFSKNKPPDATTGDLWATFGPDGYYAQSGVGFPSAKS